MDREIAMGAQKWVDLHRYQSIDTCLSGLRKRGYQLVATVPHGKAIDLADFSIRQPAALMFGTEKEGLSEEVIAQCDSCLQIPMYGFTESLNISVAAAIILQDLSSRLRRSDVPWRLDDEAQRELVYAWTCNTIKSVDQIIERYTERKKR
jgi:tRNA (guanosine-2'-O-)-methyltransferase